MAILTIFHKDFLIQSRISKNERDIQSVLRIVNNIFIKFFSHNDLLCISNGLVAKHDLLSARGKGIKAMEAFHELRLGGTPDQEFLHQ